MNPPNERLEHLFSRYLDGECDPAEARLLESLLDEHADVRAAFDEYRRFDAAIGDAMRLALGRAPATDTLARAARGAATPKLWLYYGRYAAVAAAAVVALATWLRPPHAQTAGGRENGKLQQAASWFAAPQPAVDSVEQLPRAFERPEVGLRGVQRDFLVVPGDRPGTYMVVEVDHVRTHAVRLHQDF